MALMLLLLWTIMVLILVIDGNVDDAGVDCVAADYDANNVGGD